MLKITQRTLAELAGVGINTLTKIERNEGNPSLDVLERILDTLSEREKGLVRERFVNGASFEEMAQKEKTTVGAIRSALARLRKKARRLAGDERG